MPSLALSAAQWPQTSPSAPVKVTGLAGFILRFTFSACFISWSRSFLVPSSQGSRYGDFKCNHDPTHRVCATLLDGQGQPLDWGSKARLERGPRCAFLLVVLRGICQNLADGEGERERRRNTPLKRERERAREKEVSSINTQGVFDMFQRGMCAG